MWKNLYKLIFVIWKSKSYKCNKLWTQTSTIATDPRWPYMTPTTPWLQKRKKKKNLNSLYTVNWRMLDMFCSAHIRREGGVTFTTLHRTAEGQNWRYHCVALRRPVSNPFHCLGAAGRCNWICQPGPSDSRHGCVYLCLPVKAVWLSSSQSGSHCLATAPALSG